MALATPSSVPHVAMPVMSRRAVRVARVAVIVAGAGLAVVVGHDGTLSGVQRVSCSPQS